jgi:hypothetical protein
MDLGTSLKHSASTALRIWEADQDATLLPELSQCIKELLILLILLMNIHE